MTTTVERKSQTIKGSLPTWGVWERMVPEMVAEGDHCTQQMLDIHLGRYQTASRYVQGKKVLDIASGTGFGSKMLKQAGAEQVIGVDISPVSIQYAQEHYQTAGVTFVQADAEVFEWPEQFDVIVSFETIEHVPHPDRFLAQIRKLLKPDGHFLLSVPLGETRHIDPYHLHVFSQEDVFQQFAQAGFVIDAYRIDDWTIQLADLELWKKLYPESRVSLKELFFTWRGRRVVWDLIKHRCLAMPQIMVHAQLASAIPNPPQVLQHLD
ncbi:MAG: class I SAM-dependent methyltransferase [Elainella sp. C42_A2020_010]|nr:class I SAM-dependent methyltransferase [Elainella sp. C42_A2020_010]